VADDDHIEPSTNLDHSEEIDPATLHAGFDRYRSLSDPHLTIFVDIVPPFRFKSGGRELLQSSIELGSAMKARIAEKGFSMFRANEDQNRRDRTDRPSIPSADRYQGRMKERVDETVFKRICHPVSTP
jgi:hypothetical protein